VKPQDTALQTLRISCFALW